MITKFSIKSIKDVDISNKIVLMRADFDVPFGTDGSISDDSRIRCNIPTLKYLLEHKCRVICIAKLNRPEKRDPKHSLKLITDKLPAYLPDYSYRLIDDFLTEDPSTFSNQKNNEIFVLENIRFYPEEDSMDASFTEKLAHLGEIFVMDAFAMAHRDQSSVTGIPEYIPGFSGISFENEVNMILNTISEPKKPFVTISGGAKISDKIHLLEKFITISDHLLLGGGLANTFLAAQGLSVGESLCEKDNVEKAKYLYSLKDEHGMSIHLPEDVEVALNKEDKPMTVSSHDIREKYKILDIGPKTRELYKKLISEAGTIIWNGPVGYFENPDFRKGTDEICKAITSNPNAISIVGGGDTLNALAGHENLDHISHISTGGGAMLELIEKGTLPGITALQKSQSTFNM